MANSQRIVRGEHIIIAIGSFRGQGFDHIVNNHACRIKKMIRYHGGPEVIKVIRSPGFRLG